MTEPELVFTIDEVFNISGKGTVLTGKLIKDICLGEEIILVSANGNVHATTSILGIDVYRNETMAGDTKASSGESVGIWTDLPEKNIIKGMGVFLEKKSKVAPSIDEIIDFLNKISENAVKHRKLEIYTQLEKYLFPLKKKEMELIYLDDYGDLCFDRWWEECNSFIEKKLMLLKLDIIEECRLLFRRNHKVSGGEMEICNEYLNGRIVDCIRYYIDELLEDVDEI